jgi:hypothetical protein
VPKGHYILSTLGLNLTMTSTLKEIIIQLSRELSNKLFSATD